MIKYHCPAIHQSVLPERLSREQAVNDGKWSIPFFFPTFMSLYWLFTVIATVLESTWHGILEDYNTEWMVPKFLLAVFTRFNTNVFHYSLLEFLKPLQAKLADEWLDNDTEVFTLPLLFRADSIGLRVSRMDIFLLFHHSIFPRIFWSWSEHFWPDHSVQRTFPMDCQWTNNKPATEMTRTDGIPTDIANGSPTEFRRTWPTEVRQKSDGLQASRLVISINNENNMNNN